MENTAYLGLLVNQGLQAAYTKQWIDGDNKYTLVGYLQRDGQDTDKDVFDMLQTPYWRIMQVLQQGLDDDNNEVFITYPFGDKTFRFSMQDAINGVYDAAFTFALYH